MTAGVSPSFWRGSPAGQIDLAWLHRQALPGIAAALRAAVARGAVVLPADLASHHREKLAQLGIGAELR